MYENEAGKKGLKHTVQPPYNRNNEHVLLHCTYYKIAENGHTEAVGPCLLLHFKIKPFLKPLTLVLPQILTHYSDLKCPFNLASNLSLL